ncbi:sphingosine 1-phosphate receptor 4 [Corythoichthys intestinalis]|uniref:sphingosine 1-phosphate receptor 4 n=1 Tax=Corythoichthys intestinalis TaxID=161448 RepID=UPI0025A4FED8|nr:sphingosine 1-phosphate receptor 4 [Corythoichthys intestinalis]XP_061791174.1 sphingosine 1-phosphate receptor 4-like [Nerophis lumbriciformis]
MDFLSSLTSSSSCPHLYHLSTFPGNTSLSTVSDISQVIFLHYNHTGRLKNRNVYNSQNNISASMIAFLFISIFIILENSIVLMAVVFRIRRSWRWVYVCIANITLSDLLTGVAYLVNICMSGSWTFQLTPALWLFREGMLFVTLAASIFSLLLIAVERYMTIMKPLPQKSARSTFFRIYGLVALCWALALVIGFLPLLGWNCVCSLDKCSTLLPLYSKTYILFCLSLFILILLAIGVLYGAIYSHVHKSARLQRCRKRSMALLKTVIIIVGIFLLCWGPLFLLLLVDFFCTSRQCRPLFSADFFISLAVLNSGVNPIIYALGSSEMRRAMAQLLCRRCLKEGLCCLEGLSSKDTSSTSESKQDSLRNSFNNVRNLSVAFPPPTPKKACKTSKKCRLSSTTSCLSVSSG